MHHPIGIDPASGKETYIWMDSKCVAVKAQNVRSYLEKILSRQANKFVIAWDAPIAFSETSYSDRAIDKNVRRYLKQMIEQGILEKKAVNALPFSGLSHWVISCKALGVPFGELLPQCEIAKNKSYFESDKHQIIEVHPAVSMAFMWRDMEMNVPFPIYKNSRVARELIIEKLGFPYECSTSDDKLDAYVAHQMALGYINGNALYPNDPLDGSYVLPIGKTFDELRHLMGGSLKIRRGRNA